MRKIHITGLIMIGILIAYIVSTSSSYSTYETFETAYSNNGKDFQVVGLLAKEKQLHYNPTENPNYFAFFMTDKDGTERKVVYKGPKPQDFERSEQIVLTGQMKGEEFHASKILLKCPSKYEGEQAPGNFTEDGYYEVKTS